MKFKKILAGLLAVAMVVTSVQLPAMQTKAEETKEDLKIWYSSPAADSYTGWEQWALPLGNSGIGASVFGGVSRDRIQLNEKSLWSGGPSASRPNYMGGNLENRGQNGAIMKQVQELMASGQTSQAVSLCNQLVGVSDDAGTQGYGYYLSYGNMYLNFAGVTESNVTNYYRDLDLRTAVATVEYDYNGTHYTRESFVSYPDNVLVTNITAEGNGDIDVEVAVQPDNVKGNGSNNPGSSSYTRNATTTVKNGMISIEGKLDDNQMKFVSHTKVIADGTVTDKASTVAVADAKTVTIITSIATDYKNEYPVYRTGETDAELSARVNNYVAKAVAKDYEDLKEDHIADYDNIFGRVELEIGQDASEKTTDALLNAYKNGSATDAEKRYLEVMMFQYGRYLTIEASRETPEDDPYRATLPTNLQGMWVGANNSAWHSDYHMNVNLQMNYWPTYSTNMAECAEPLIDYVDSLREPGRVTAKIYAGIESTEANPENGFMAHTQNNPFGWTCPGWSFDWGWSPAGVPWILQNCWEYYEYTGDVEYMEEHIYPMLKEEAVFYNQFLVRNNDGELVSSPSYSPEQGPRTEGNTYEHSLIWQLYEDAMTAAEILGKDADLAATWAANQADLKGPIEIGDSGQIKEWYNETTFNKDQNGNNMGEGFNHRHISHMLGLFPGDLIQKDAEWVEAAKVSMENRTDNSTGWGMAQRICTWARLENGNRAYKVLKDLISQKILSNLWDTHPPFQIDGNYGLTAGVAEMLLQSNMGYIDLLPALPDTWADGNVDGLLARGNFEVDMAWEKTNLTEATILSNIGGDCVVSYPTIVNAKVLDEAGKEVKATKVDDTTISFATEAGKSYTVTEVPVKPLENLGIEGKAKLNITVTAESQLTATYEPAASEGNGVEWSVDDESVAVIDENGLLRAKKPGTVVVTATYKDDPTKTATKEIAVVKEPAAAEMFADRAVLTDNAMANSEQWPAAWTDDGRASWAFDGENHWWHSRYQNFDQKFSHEIGTAAGAGKPSATNPIWIQTGFDQVFYVDHIDYTPRGDKGIFKDYKVSVANLEDPTATPTDADFTVVKSGTLAGVQTKQTIQLDETVPATHVRITITSVTCNGDGHVAAKHIDIYGFDGLAGDSEVTTTVLDSAVEYADTFVEADYTADSWAALQAAVAAANVGADATQDEVYAATAAIYAAIDALVAYQPTPEVTPTPQPTPGPSVTDMFTDIAEGKWYTANVQYVYDKGLMSGNDGLFNPTGNVTRAQVVTTLYRLAGSPEVTDYSACDELSDVLPGKYYTDPVCWAYNTGVTTGNTSTMTFNVSTPVTRQQLASFFYRFAEYKGYDISESADISTMLNADKVSGYALTYVKWAVGAGIISGSETTGANGAVAYDLKPQATATRAQLAAILQRFCENNGL